MDPLLKWRAEFPSLDRCVHLISHSLGAMPKRAADRIAQYVREWDARSVRAWEEGWWDMPVTVGDLIGRIIGAGEGEVCMHQNVSIAQSVVLSCFDWSGPRNKIVSDALNFPSNEYLHRAIRGAELIMVEADEQAIVDAIDDRTQLVSLSHVAFRTSALLDLKPIVEKAHRVGAMVAADLYQSAGCVTLDVRALGVDFAVGGSVKWLCGGPGNGYLYVRRDLWPRLSPAATGWQAHARPFEFETGPIDYANSIYKFLNGTPNVPAMYAGMSGYEIVGEIGAEAIREKSIRQTQCLIELAEAAGFRNVGPRDPSKRGGTVVIDVPGGRDVVKELARRDILCDYRPGAGVRLAPHFYTKDEELETAVAAITEVRESLAR
ncbi:MAG: aminotransferase class V-fold PLP-dependent enzyme [Bryobacteraceae bacterium]|nr:aminotransferase class V-fold PLP-dependent enzyme [Bryobacteraceae bacterium]